MSNEITNDMDVIDSRDIIERIEELENEIEERGVDTEGLEEINLLRQLAEEGEQYSDDWQYGSTLIRESYFEDYMDEMIDDCYSDVINTKDMPYWMSITYDYVALKQDYTEVDFDGITYLIR